MERTDWLDEGLSPADARFLMMTAITHHRVNSPIWGQREVRKLHAELAEIQRLTVEVVVEHAGSRTRRRTAGPVASRSHLLVVFHRMAGVLRHIEQMMRPHGAKARLGRQARPPGAVRDAPGGARP